MNRTYDIFRILPDFAPLWVDAVVGLEQARKRLNDLADVESAKYFDLRFPHGDVHQAASCRPGCSRSRNRR